MACCSVIITTYNRPDALALVLHALNAQSQTDFEVLIADDGSIEDTRLMLQAFPVRFPLRHVWQADQGFRAARIRNLAIAQAQGDYVIFLDGDCVVRPDFIARHCALAETDCFVSGNRVLCQADFSNEILRTQTPVWQWSWRQWLRAYQRSQINRYSPLLTLPGQTWRKRKALQHWRGVKTCNLGVWRRALLAINGFDESYQGWGHEDADLAVRLLQAGQQRKDGRFYVPVLHLWHKPAPRAQEQENWQRLQAALQGERATVTAHGINKTS
jgi:GT2 family glycosyltransferase